ncbi:MAG: sugar phosphate isomerase/epimerase [Pirellulales bacterium]|nr:sugar phosphate isomerase/epimerase [Pirellulales bacterium]
MKLGFVTAILPELSLNEVLAFAAAEDYDNVEVMCWPMGPADRRFAGVTHIDVAGFTQAQADDVNALCDRHGVGISGLGYYPNPMSNNPQEAETAIAHLLQVIDAARLLGLKNVNTFIGNDHTRDLEHNFERFQRVWPAIIRHAEERDVRIGIENCPMYFGQNEWPGGKNMARSPEIWRRMFAAIPSAHFGLNFDPSHFILQMMDYIEPMYEFRDKLFHTHAKDLKIDRKALNAKGAFAIGWEVPKLPGLGDVNWNAWISALTDVGYQGTVSVEVEDDAFRHELSRRKLSLRISHDVLRPLIGGAARG